MTKIRKSMAAFMCLALMFTVATVLHADDYHYHYQIFNLEWALSFQDEVEAMTDEELASFALEIQIMEEFIETQRQIDELNLIAQLYFEGYLEGIIQFGVCLLPCCNGVIEPHSSSNSFRNGNYEQVILGNRIHRRYQYGIITSTWVGCPTCSFQTGHNSVTTAVWGDWYIV